MDLSENDPLRAEIIGYINEVLLPTTYDRSYNLADYDELVAEAEANRAGGETVEKHESHYGAIPYSETFIIQTLDCDMGSHWKP